jgi:TP901 family phage tail tape measure protein
MREYFRFAGAATKTFGKLFTSEFDTINKVAEDNVKRLQTQYIKLGRDSTGAMRAIAVMPKELDLTDYSVSAQMAAQRQALFNQLVKQGSTNLLNFGKNTQWAGRQLMVGFTIPLIALGTAATKTFMDMEAQVIKFRKVYGDLFTPAEERQQALADITALGQMFTKYGIAVSDTVGLAAEAAAAGFQGVDLQRQTTEATRLQVLGQIDAQKALETTISLQNAFQLQSEELADAINFLNAVENQTVVSLDDITTAIPKAAPVVKQLGGDVRDLAFFMAAMKEGGINASEGANALKSGLASLINPTDKAREMMQGFGIDIDSIVNKNAGNVKQTVIEFAQALDNLSDLNRQRAIEQLFGKFQLARLSTLFENVTKSGNQASRVLDLATASTADLAAMAEKELGMTAESAMNKFRKAVEDLKVALVPVGEVFLQTITPIAETLGNLLSKFNSLSDGTKKAIAVITIAIGGIAPVLLMTFGLLANFVANAIKFFAILRNGYLKLTGQSQILGAQTEYLTTEQLNAAAAAHSLDQSHANLTQTFNVEKQALDRLIASYKSALTASRNFAAANPGMMLPGAMGRGRKKFAKGVVSVPGPKGAGDVVPAMLSPGEAVIPSAMAKKYAPLIQGMVSGNIPGFQEGLFPGYTNAVTLLSSKANQALKSKGGFSAAQLAQEFRAGGAGIQAPIVRAIAEAMGATKPSEVVRMIKNDPNLAKFGSNISTGVADELAKISGKVTDPQLGKIYQKVAKEQAKAFGGVYAKATKSFFNDLTTFEDVTQTRVSQSSGRTRSIGRAAIFKNKMSYRSMGFGAIAAALGLGSLKGKVKAHMTEKQMIDLQTLAATGQLTPTAIAAIERSGVVVPKEIKDEVKKQKSKQTTTKRTRTPKATPPPPAPKATIGQRVGSFGKSLMGGRAGMAASTALMAGSFLPGRAGQVAGQAAGLAFGAQALSMIFKLPIPHIKAFTAVVAGTVGVMKLANKARERERVAIEGLADAATLTENKVKTLGEFFGVVPTKTPFESGLPQIVGTPTQRSAIQQLRESEGFQRDFKTDIGVLRGATNAEAAGVFKSIAIGLQGRGFATEQIQTIIDALRTEAGKTSVVLDVKSLTLGTKGGRENLEKTAAQIAKDFTTAFATGFEKDMVLEGQKGEGGQSVGWVQKLIPTKELQKQTKFAAAQFNSLLSGISGAFANGAITANQFNKSFDSVSTSLQALDKANPGAALMLVQQIMKTLPKDVAKVASGIKSLEGNMLILKLQALGMTSSIVVAASALKLLESSGEDADRFGAKAEMALDGVKKKAKAVAKETQKALEEVFGGGKNGAGGGKDKFSLTKFLTENLEAVQTQTKALNKMRKAGISAKMAADLAANPDAAKAIVKLAEKGGKAWKTAKDQIEAYEKAQEKLADAEFAAMGPGAKMQTAFGKLSAYYDLQEELINLSYAEALQDQNDKLAEQEILLDNVNNKIEDINNTIETKLAPLQKIIEDNNFELERISIIEDDINEKYDKQQEALSKVLDLNEAIAQIQRGRLSVADALSRGDLSEAASAIQELRAAQAGRAGSTQQQLLDNARQQELSALNRVKIERQNKLLQFEIARMQRETSAADLASLESKKKAIEANISSIERNINSIEANIQTKVIAMSRTFEASFGITKAQIDGVVKALDLTQAAGMKDNKRVLDLVLKAATGDATALNKALADAPSLMDPVLTKFEKLYDLIKNIFIDANQQSETVPVGGSSPTNTRALTKTEEQIYGITNEQLDKIISGSGSSGTSAVSESTSPNLFEKAPTIDNPIPWLDPKANFTSPWDSLFAGMTFMAGGGKVKPKYFANGAFARGTDTIPAMLSPGEFVVRKSAVDSIGVNALNKINDGSYGSGVYNYNLSVTLNGSNMDANDVANTVIQRIKQVESQRIRRQVL